MSTPQSPAVTAMSNDLRQVCTRVQAEPGSAFTIWLAYLRRVFQPNFILEYKPIQPGRLGEETKTQMKPFTAYSTVTVWNTACSPKMCIGIVILERERNWAVEHRSEYMGFSLAWDHMFYDSRPECIGVLAVLGTTMLTGLVIRQGHARLHQLMHYTPATDPEAAKAFHKWLHGFSYRYPWYPNNSSQSQ